MSQWGRASTNAGAPKFQVIGTTSQSNATNIPLGNNAFVNTTPGIFVNNMVVGVFGVNNAIAASVGKKVSPGWVSKLSGTGPVLNIAIATPGSLNSNAHLVRISNGSVNASATLVTNASGAVTGVTLTGNGRGFINLAATVIAMTNATGGTTGLSANQATFTITLGGRAGRLTYEQLVAFRGAGAGITGANTALT